MGQDSALASNSIKIVNPFADSLHFAFIFRLITIRCLISGERYLQL